MHSQWQHEKQQQQQQQPQQQHEMSTMCCAARLICWRPVNKYGVLQKQNKITYFKYFFCFIWYCVPPWSNGLDVGRRLPEVPGSNPLISLTEVFFRNFMGMLLMGIDTTPCSWWHQVGFPAHRQTDRHTFPQPLFPKKKENIRVRDHREWGNTPNRW